MDQALGGPHLWVLLGTMLYLMIVVASILRAIRLDHLSVSAQVVWSLAMLLFPIGGLVLFWIANPPKRRAKSTE